MTTRPVVPTRWLCALLDAIVVDQMRKERAGKVRKAKSRPENKRAGVTHKQVTPA